MRRPIRNVDRAAQTALISGRRDADSSCEQRAERSEAAEADVQAHVRHRVAACQQSSRRGQSFTGPELVRRFAEDCLESADEVIRRQVRCARGLFNRDVRGLHVRKQIPCAAQSAESRAHFRSPTCRTAPRPGSCRADRARRDRAAAARRSTGRARCDRRDRRPSADARARSARLLRSAQRLA